MKNSKSSGSLILQGLVGAISAALFVLSLSMSHRMTWWQGLLAGMLCGAVSGTLMRMARDAGSSNDNED